MTAPEKDEAREDQEAAEAKPEAAAPEEVEADVIEDDAESEEPEEDPVEAAKAEADAWRDKYFRLHAEWDTYRRRMNEQREEEKLRATEKLVESLIPVIDDFERSIAYAEGNGEEGLLGGIKAVHNKIGEVLKKEGVEIINPEGEAFDALEAQAVATVDDPSVPDETVAQVYQKGYRMGNNGYRGRSEARDQVRRRRIANARAGSQVRPCCKHLEGIGQECPASQSWAYGRVSFGLTNKKRKQG